MRRPVRLLAGRQAGRRPAPRPDRLGPLGRTGNGALRPDGTRHSRTQLLTPLPQGGQQKNERQQRRGTSRGSARPGQGTPPARPGRIRYCRLTTTGKCWKRRSTPGPAATAGRRPNGRIRATAPKRKVRQGIRKQCLKKSRKRYGCAPNSPFPQATGAAATNTAPRLGNPEGAPTGTASSGWNTRTAKARAYAHSAWTAGQAAAPKRRSRTRRRRGCTNGCAGREGRSPAWAAEPNPPAIPEAAPNRIGKTRNESPATNRPVANEPERKRRQTAGRSAATDGEPAQKARNRCSVRKRKRRKS